MTHMSPDGEYLVIIAGLCAACLLGFAAAWLVRAVRGRRAA